MITLLVGFYHDPDQRRQAELLECLRLNGANPHLTAVHLFLEDSTGPAAHLKLDLSKIQPVAHGQRVTYQDMFAYAGQYLAGSTVIVANADIYFDESLALLEGYDLTGRLLCLSRWDVGPDGSSALFNHPSSQDAWVFRAPLPAFPCDFQLGVLGCDNRLAWEAARAGLLLSNPSLSLRAYHLHLSQVRRYAPCHWLPGPALPVPPGPLDPHAAHPEPRSLGGGAHSEPTMREPMIALTSLPAGLHCVDQIGACIASWRELGLQVYALNHPQEIELLAGSYDVEFVPVAQTTEAILGQRFVPLNAMLDWAATADASVLLINADIQLRLSDWELRRIRWLSDGGLCYFVRYNHDGELAQASREPYGIDAFLLHGRDAAGFAESFLSMEQPFSDYWLPLTLAARGLPLYAVDFPAAFHLSHQNGWSWETWHRCALEFNRVTGALGPDTSFDACMAAAWGVREQLDHQKIGLGQRPPPIRPWVEQTFGDPGPKLFLELGAHRGEDTAWMAAIPNVTIHAFEPDPRNYHATQPNVTLHQAAIADRDGRGPLHLSQEGWGQEWTCSSSIRRPKNHLQRFPVSFAGAVEVELVALDSFRRRYGLERIDFIWADIQGAEREMIQGGHETLARTRYIYTEYSDDELYEGQATLRELLTLLPSFRVIELWPDEVLLENQALAAAGR